MCDGDALTARTSPDTDCRDCEHYRRFDPPHCALAVFYADTEALIPSWIGICNRFVHRDKRAARR